MNLDASAPGSLGMFEPSTSPSTRTHCPYCAFQCGMIVRIGTEGGLEPTPEISPDPDFPVNAGQMSIFLLSFRNPDMAGTALVPTTSVDQYGATIGRWFGATDSELATIFPNLPAFSPRYLNFL